MKQILVAFTSIVLVFMCSCAQTKNAVNNTTAQPTGTVDTPLPSESFDPEIPLHMNLSYIMMYKIADCYARTCGAYEFDEKDVVPYEAIFGYFAYEGCYTFDQTMISPLVFPYFNEIDYTVHIPSGVVDDYLSDRFNTIPNPERIDLYADSFYNNETDCYEFNVVLSGILDEIDIRYEDRISEGENIYRFKARYYSLEDEPDTLVRCSTFTVELTSNGYRILAHTQTTEKPSAKIRALRNIFADQGN